jgi:hypothetical protein
MNGRTDRRTIKVTVALIELLSQLKILLKQIRVVLLFLFVTAASAHLPLTQTSSETSNLASVGIALSSVLYNCLDFLHAQVKFPVRRHEFVIFIIKLYKFEVVVQLD